MKTLIKIDRKSIRENADAGNTYTLSHIGNDMSFISQKRIPQKLLDLVIIKSESFDNSEGELYYKCTGIIINPDNFGIFAKLGDIQIEYERDFEKTYHHPIPKYSFKYKYPKLECEDCKNKVRMDKITVDYEDDCSFTVCPTCKSVDSFPDFYKFEYENIENVMKELEAV